MGPPSKQQNIRKAKETLNLRGLQRYDPTITRIIDQTSHVVIYYYDTQANGWEKEGVEGALFFYQRSVAPYYGFTVMNRVGLDNFSALFQPTLEIQLTTDFIIFRDVRGANPSNKEEKEQEEWSVSSNDMSSEDGEGCTQYVYTESGQVVPVATRQANKVKSTRGQESHGKTKRPVIHGIWIYDAKDRTRIGQIMNQLRMACMTPPSSATVKLGSSTTAPASTKRTKPKGAVKKGRDSEESVLHEPKVAAAKAPVSTTEGQVEASKKLWKMLESARGTTPEPQRNFTPQPTSPSSHPNRTGRAPAGVAQLKHNLLNQLQSTTLPSATVESQPPKLTSPTRKYSTSSSVTSLPTSPQVGRATYGLRDGAISVGPYPQAPVSPTHSTLSVGSPRTSMGGPALSLSQPLVDHSMGASNSQKLLALLKQGPTFVPSNAGGQPAQVVTPPTTTNTQSSLLSILTGKPTPTSATQDQRPAPTPPPPSMLPMPHFPLLPGPVPPMHMMSGMGYPMPMAPMVPPTYQGNHDPHAMHVLNTAIPMHVAQQQQASSQEGDTRVNLLSREDFQIQSLHALQHDSALVDHLYREYCALVQQRPGNYGLVAPFFPSMVPHMANPHPTGPPLPQATYAEMNGNTSIAMAPAHLVPTDRVSSPR